MDKKEAQSKAIRDKADSKEKGGYDQEGGKKHKKADGVKCSKCGK